MTAIWGIHNDRRDIDLVGGGFVSIGWAELGDLTATPVTRDTLKEALARVYPAARPGAYPVWAGVINRFVNDIEIGDYVVSPHKASRTLNIGTVASAAYDTPDSEHRTRRRVEWIRTDIPRNTLPASALYELGSALTLFQVKRHTADILGLIDGAADQPAPDIDTTDLVEDEASASRVDTYTRDFIAGVLQQLEPSRFEDFVAALLTAMGYVAERTQYSGDGGVDVIASKDPLRLIPPIIKVQCKRTTSSVGGPVVQNLLGTLAHGGNELALFVTLGGYTNDAIHIARTRHDLRLITGDDLTDLILDHYHQLAPEWQRHIPLRHVYAVDRDGTT